MIQNLPTKKWKPLLRGSGNIKTVRKIVSSNTRFPVTARLAVIGSYTTNALALGALSMHISDALTGNKQAQLQVVAGSFDLLKGHLISTYGGTNMNIAMAGVAFLSYALNKFMTTTLNEYNEDWWQKYSDYLLDKYPYMVTGSESWVELYKEKGEV